MTHSDAERQHELVVQWLYNRLMKKDVNRRIKTHKEYFLGKLLFGEADVVTYQNGCIHYYEVKGHYHPRNFERAREQFKHFQKSHPCVETKFIYVSPERVKRLYLK